MRVIKVYGTMDFEENLSQITEIWQFWMEQWNSTHLLDVDFFKNDAWETEFL